MPPIDSPPSTTVIVQNSPGYENLSTITLFDVQTPPLNTPMSDANVTADLTIANTLNGNGVNMSGSLGSFTGMIGSCFTPLLSGWFNSSSRLNYNSDTDDADHYEISLESIEVNFKENYIGGGNQSSVFRGKLNGRYIALKKLNRASEVDIKTLKQMNHPNVIKTLGVCTKDIYPCIVMEYCEKGGLFDVLRKTEVSKAFFCHWTREIASGMHYLHSLKIIHRDLKSPNILVDKHDCLKICDFGSLYAYEKTHMPSIVMSVCGTSQWMSPEMLKNHPCNEKVDVWSFGVVCWELLTQEIPYNNIAPMSVMFGVGSDALRLHTPKTSPDSARYLLNLCWAKRPKNRPSFASILILLGNLVAEVADMSEDAWTMRKGVWKKEIHEENEKLMHHNSMVGEMCNSNQQKSEELVIKRMHELRHAQEIRQMYEEKYARVEKMLRQVFTFSEDVRLRADELYARERRLLEEEHRLSVHGHHYRQQYSGQQQQSPQSVQCQFPTLPCARAISLGPSSRATTRNNNNNRPVRVQKSMIVRLDSSRERGNSNHNKIECCVASGQRAVLRMSIDDDDDDEDDEYEGEEINEEYGPTDGDTLMGDVNMVLRQRQRTCSGSSSSSDEATHKYSFNANTPSSNKGAKKIGHCPSECSTFSRMAPVRNSAGPTLTTQKPGPNRATYIPAFVSERCFQSTTGEPTICPCCQHSFFDRNSLARASGLSADSGFCYLDDQLSGSPRVGSANNLDATNLNVSQKRTFGGYSSMENDTPLPMNRNVQSRWSDGRLQQKRRTTRRPALHHIPSTYLAGSPLRNSSSAKKERRSYIAGLTNSADQIQRPRASSITKISHHAKYHERECPVDVEFEVKPREKSSVSVVSKSIQNINTTWHSSTPHAVASNIHIQDYNRRIFELRVGQLGASTSSATCGDKERKKPPTKSYSFPQSPQQGDFKEIADDKILTEIIDLNGEGSDEVAAVAAAMLASGSTMVSSLERSLEMAITNSDGLSDKESKLKAAKSSFKATHRRTASNPINLPLYQQRPSTVCETSTESDNDPVYC